MGFPEPVLGDEDSDGLGSRGVARRDHSTRDVDGFKDVEYLGRLPSVPGGSILPR